MKICAYCGRENGAGLESCGDCGTPLPKQKIMPGPGQKEQWNTGFCDDCLAETLDLPAETFKLSLQFRTVFLSTGEECPKCGSVVKRLFGTAFFLPLFPLGCYRVKKLSPNQYLTRKVGTKYKYGDAQQMLNIAAELEAVDPVTSIIKYQRIIDLFPGTVPSEEAERNSKCLIKSLIGREITSPKPE